MVHYNVTPGAFSLQLCKEGLGTIYTVHAHFINRQQQQKCIKTWETCLAPKGREFSILYLRVPQTTCKCIKFEKKFAKLTHPIFQGLRHVHGHRLPRAGSARHPSHAKFSPACRSGGSPQPAMQQESSLLVHISLLLVERISYLYIHKRARYPPVLQLDIPHYYSKKSPSITARYPPI